ncbi:hypothetical protein H8Z75_23420 (plasmid) [Xanthomonas citri pv. citri]|nr:hypothetical protein H8Z75_23420 [Xanthomonas citri pv. citri]
MRAGVILFDLADNIVGSDRTIVNLEGAWASISGSDAVRVNSVHDLPSDVLWLTNLNFNSFFRAGLSRHPNFRRSDWLRATLAQLIEELGVAANTTATHKTASTMAVLVQRVLNVAMKRYGVQPSARNGRLNADFAERLGVKRCAIPDDLYPIFQSIAEHPSVNVIHNINHTALAPTVTVRRNRLAHARRIMGTAVPSDSRWERMRRVQSDDGWLEKVETPFLVKAEITNVKPVIAEVLSWGGGSRNMRDWLTDIEWRVVRQYGTVYVREALICREQATPLVQQDKLPTSEVANLSITEGMIAEQVWTAFTVGQAYKGNESRFNAAAAWLRSEDRMAMFDYAQKLYARGLDVQSYGVGNVVLRFPERGLKRVLDIATDLGLIPPAAKFAEAAMGRVA